MACEDVTFGQPKKTFEKASRNPCFSNLFLNFLEGRIHVFFGNFFFDGPPSIATGPSDQTFWRAEITGFSGFIFFVGPPSIATGPSDQTFWTAEITGFSGGGHVGTLKNIFRKRRLIGVYRDLFFLTAPHPSRPDRRTKLFGGPNSRYFRPGRDLETVTL
jgi:hypothetical protein